jgi:phasin family protein
LIDRLIDRSWSDYDTSLTTPWAAKQLHAKINIYRQGKMADKTVMDMFADMAKQINLPKIDYEAFVDVHRKNIEAMQKSAAVLSEGGRAVLAKQQEILAEVGREARQLIADFKPGGSPQEIAAKQAELAKRVFEATVKNTRDVAELVQKSSSEAPKIILDRMRESFAEARAAIESKKA